MSDMERCIIKEYVILGVGCKILCTYGILTIGKDAIIAANAVVICDVPAKKLYTRNKDDIFHGS